MTGREASAFSPIPLFMIRGSLLVRCGEPVSSEKFRFRESSTSDTGSPEDEDMGPEDELRLGFNVSGLGSISGARKGLAVSTIFACSGSAVGGVGERVL